MLRQDHPHLKCIITVFFRVRDKGLHCPIGSLDSDAALVHLETLSWYMAHALDTRKRYA